MSVSSKQLNKVMESLTEDKLASLKSSEKKELDNLIIQLEKSIIRERSQDEFLNFAGSVWSEFMCGSHHKKMAEAFERVASGDCKRLMINMPPRFGKSQLTSWLLP